MCNPGRNEFFLIFYPSGKAGGSQIRRCQEIVVKRYDFTLGALALTPAFATTSIVQLFSFYFRISRRWPEKGMPDVYFILSLLPNERQ